MFPPTRQLPELLVESFSFALVAVAQDICAVALHPRDRNEGHPSEN
jgi:hypothetical protein